LRNRALRRIAAVAMASLWLLAPQASAAPRAVGVDRSDNRVHFSYDSGTGSIPSQTTAAQSGINPDVDFEVTIDEAEGSGPGLLAKITLRLDADRAQTYDGWFAIHVEDGDGQTVFHRTRPRFVRLRPEPGCRRVSLRYAFDLPSDDYDLVGTFHSQ
jgi:hypothetical protein